MHLARASLASRFLAALACCAALSAGCKKAVPRPELEVETLTGHAHRVPERTEGEKERRVCEQRIRAVLAEPEVPGAPEFTSQRLAILSQAKAEPVLLVDTPRFVDDPGVLPAIKTFRELIRTTRFPWDVLQQRLPRYRELPDEGRATLLRDGYLYAETPELAYALVNLVGAEHLFKEPEIWVQRGEFIFHAKRVRGHYYYSDGPNEGEEVRLLLFDRAGTGPDPDPKQTLVRDFRALKYRLNFTRAKVRHVTRDHIVATLRYDDHAVPTLLRADGARLELECEILSDSLRTAVDAEKTKTARRQHVVQGLRYAMLEQIDEQLPFDEPRHEYGHQLDGALRRNWMAAYVAQKRTFAYNGDRYDVFDAKGRPLAPQVCVDFLTDTLERASGTHFRPKGQPPGRDIGHLNLEMDALESAKLRRVPGFLAFARAHSDQFEVLDIEPRERIPLGDRARLLHYLEEEWRDYQPGDIVVIRGPTPWDPKEEHYHSFFIYETDPLTGTPLALVGNAGRPSVRFWEVEARRTPERTIWHRLRLKTDWLASIMDESHPITDEPPPISPRGNAG